MTTFRFLVGFPFFIFGMSFVVLGGFLMGEDNFNRILDEIFNPSHGDRTVQ